MKHKRKASKGVIDPNILTNTMNNKTTVP